VTSPFDARPIIVAIAGPNGAGKSTFYEAHLRSAGLRFVNADELARELGVDAYQAAEVAGSLRKALVEQGESFVFETVFSDPAGDKLEFLKLAERKGYAVVLCFIGLDGPDLSEERVAMRVLQGGHDVPTAKLRARYPRTLANLAKAIKERHAPAVPKGRGVRAGKGDREAHPAPELAAARALTCRGRAAAGPRSTSQGFTTSRIHQRGTAQRFGGLCLANTPSVLAGATPGAPAIHGREARAGREASGWTAAPSSRQDSRDPSQEGIGRERASTSWTW
jgi:predicted ABC-type ATPase